jgi:UDP-N-acetylglucosamine 4,6-dehydratase/5-epimerase
MKEFKNKTILITGGTGSFGESLLTKYAKKNIFKEIRILSRDEKKQDDLRKKFNNSRIKFFIGDVRDKDSLDLATHNCNFIFHAAALKQVPSCEFFPLEAVKTNIIGSNNLLDVAIKNNVKKVIMLSTDKAVYPINVMGLSKSLMEKNLIAKSRFLKKKDTKLCATRYGNIIASRGSVVPLFTKQILNNEYVTLTDPYMTRFLMDVDEAIELVLYAFNNGEQGDLFVRKAPACTMINLVHALEKIINKKAKIKIVGTRHGEKTHETLVSQEEMRHAYENKNFFKIRPDTRDLNYSKYFSSGKKYKKLESYNSSNTKIMNIREIVSKLKTARLSKDLFNV